MYTVEKKEYGFKLTFSGSVTEQELLDWIEESKLLLKNKTENFGVVVDLTKLKPIQAKEFIHFRDGQELYKNKGMIRSAVILKGAMLTLQFREIARKSDIFKDERYIDAEEDPNWEKPVLDWVKHAIEP